MFFDECSGVSDRIVGVELTARHNPSGVSLFLQLTFRNRLLQLFEQHERKPWVALANRAFHSPQLSHFLVEAELFDCDHRLPEGRAPDAVCGALSTWVTGGCETLS